MIASLLDLPHSISQKCCAIRAWLTGDLYAARTLPKFPIDHRFELYAARTLPRFLNRGRVSNEGLTTSDNALNDEGYGGVAGQVFFNKKLFKNLMIFFIKIF